MEREFDLKKPPVGLMPKKLWMEERIYELACALVRYSERSWLYNDNYKTMMTWISEMAYLMEEVNKDATTDGI